MNTKTMSNKNLTDCYAVIFTSKLKDHSDTYTTQSGTMLELAKKQPGFIDIESVRDGDGVGVTVSYWDSMEAIKKWQSNADHLVAQKYGQEKGYESYHLCIGKVVYDRRFENQSDG